VTKFCSTNG